MSDPQHVLLAQDLIERIQSGEFRVGDKLPTELELCASRSLARGTVRQALRHLEDAGLIARRRGAGTVVIAPPRAGGHDVFVSDHAGLLAFVRATRIRHPRSNDVVAEEDLARRIGVPEHSEWYCVEGPRVRRGAESAPICWSELYLRADLPHRRMMTTGDFGIANLIRQHIGQEVTATVLPDSLAAELGSEKGSAALVVTHRHHNSDGRIESVGVHTLPADRYRIVTTLGGHTGSTRPATTEGTE